MKVRLQPALNDPHLDASRSSHQRQLSIEITAQAELQERQQGLPINLCLVLDHSGSMKGPPLEKVKQAALRLIEQMRSEDHLSVVAFDHQAKVLVENASMELIDSYKSQIEELAAGGGTAIDEGMKLGIEEVAKAKQGRISQIFLLTDGENEHGDNERCFKFAQLAAQYNITLNALGFGVHWSQDVLEQIADIGSGSLSYIEHPEQAAEHFQRLFSRVQAVGLTNAYLVLNLEAQVRLAEFKPIAQVAPETVELRTQKEDGGYGVRLGDLSTETPRVVLANLYIGQLPPEGTQMIARVQVRYTDPATAQEGLLSESVPVYAVVQSDYQPALNPQIQKHILALAKYRQTRIAETKLQQGDRDGAATLLQSAAQTALQMGDQEAATVLQAGATRLQTGETLSQADRKKTRIVSKTVLQ